MDASYNSRLNELEWNCGLGTGSIWSASMMPRVMAVTNKLKNYGMSMTVGLDRDGEERQLSYYWREGVPVRDVPLLVTDSALVPIANGYSEQLQNGTLETWNSGRPVNFNMYNDTYFAYVTRDQAVRHSGTSSARFD